MENRCGTCRFWGVVSRKSGPDDIQSGEWRQCGRFIHDKSWHCKAKEELDYYDDEEISQVLSQPIRQELAVVEDGSGYFAALKCRADFGCVLHETAKDVWVV